IPGIHVGSSPRAKASATRRSRAPMNAFTSPVQSVTEPNAAAPNRNAAITRKPRDARTEGLGARLSQMPRPRYDRRHALAPGLGSSRLRRARARVPRSFDPGRPDDLRGGPRLLRAAARPARRGVPPRGGGAADLDAGHPRRRLGNRRAGD